MTTTLTHEFDFLPKTGRPASFGKAEGRYPFFTSSAELSKWTDFPDCEGPALVFGTGGSASLHYVEMPFSASNDCYIVRPKSRKVEDAKFYFQFLRNHMHLIEEGFRGAGLKHVTKKHLEKINLPKGHENSRSRIISILEKADGIRQKREKLISFADEMLRAHFLEAFGDPRSVGSSGVFLCDVAGISRGRFSPRPRNDPRFYDGEYPFIQTAEIAASDGYMFQYRQTLNEAGTKVSKKFPAGTVFIAIVGATIGATAISIREFWCPDSVIGIVPNSSEYPAEFIEYLLRFWRPVFVDQAPETARANINLQTLKPVPIPLCQNGEAVKFSERYKRIHALKNKLRKLDDDLFLSLSQRAFSGEL